MYLSGLEILKILRLERDSKTRSKTYLDLLNFVTRRFSNYNSESMIFQPFNHKKKKLRFLQKLKKSMILIAPITRVVSVKRTWKMVKRLNSKKVSLKTLSLVFRMIVFSRTAFLSKLFSMVILYSTSLLNPSIISFLSSIFFYQNKVLVVQRLFSSLCRLQAFPHYSMSVISSWLCPCCQMVLNI